jgi:hypothetical protein
MEKPNTNLWQFLIYIAILLISIGATYGTANSRLNFLEDCAKITSKDHDSVLLLSAKLDAIIDDIREIKTDIKEIKSKIR